MTQGLIRCVWNRGSVRSYCWKSLSASLAKSFLSQDRDWWIGFDSQRLVHWLAKKRPSIHPSLGIWEPASLSLKCVQNICVQITFRSSCQNPPKSRTAKPLPGRNVHSSAKCATSATLWEHFSKAVRRTIRSRGRESRCDFCRNVQSCQGTGNCAMVETVGPAPASIFPFCHFCRPSVRGYCPHVSHALGTTP